MSEPVRTDVVVMGGGAAGLWARCVLSRRGYSVVLLDNAPLGTGQTIASQGILHAGIKYALSGKAGRASRMLADAAVLWQRAMQGEGEVDLGGLRVLAASMHLWTRADKSSKLAAWGASRAMRSGVRRVGLDERPASFAGAPDGVDLYEVDEPVVDPGDLLRCLLDQGTGLCARISSMQPPVIRRDGGGVQIDALLGTGEPMSIRAQRVVLCAGVGNEALLGSVGADSGLAQRRPLHMVVVRDAPVPMFGHCVRMSDVPMLTITTSASGGGLVWLIGGELAEQGVELSSDEQVRAARRELAQGLPWMDLNGCDFSTFRVDRAEGRTPGGRRPDEPMIVEMDGVVAAWPTKLVLAPVLAERLADLFERAGVVRSGAGCVGDGAAGGCVSVEVGARPWEGRGVL